MRLSSFDLNEPLPELKSPHTFAVLKPWIDAGDVGTMVLQRLEVMFGARELGSIAHPGNFYDFTRYRPTTRWINEIRELIIPNTTIQYARRENGNDFLFIHMLEPHMLGEAYCNSVLAILKRFNVQRYSLIGSMYDMVPHTRPLLISGGLNGKTPDRSLERYGVYQGHYEGPTTICNMISIEAHKLGMEQMTLLVHLPQYTEIDEDYNGMVAVSRLLEYIYGIPVDESDQLRADKQIKKIDTAVNRSKKLKAIVSELEHYYDAQANSRQPEEPPKLSSEVESFLKQMEKKFRSDTR
jgi:hypothetical protein